MYQREPYPTVQPLQVALAVASDDIRPDITTDCDTKIAELMRQCWDREAENRPTFRQICDMQIGDQKVEQLLQLMEGDVDMIERDDMILTRADVNISDYTSLDGNYKAQYENQYSNLVAGQGAYGTLLQKE